MDAGVPSWRGTDVGVNARTQGLGNTSFGGKVVLIHQGPLILSQKLGHVEAKLNGSLVATCGSSGRCGLRGQGAVGFTYSLTKTTSLDAEVFGQTVSVNAPPGVYSFAGFSHKISKHFEFNGGLRFGLNDSAPTIGATIGLTIGVGGGPHNGPASK